jgi:hypothetical protein
VVIVQVMAGGHRPGDGGWSSYMQRDPVRADGAPFSTARGMERDIGSLRLMQFQIINNIDVEFWNNYILSLMSENIKFTLCVIQTCNIYIVALFQSIYIFLT